VAYEITPIAGFPAPELPEFPLYLQLQNGGVNVGEPNVRVIDIITDPAKFHVSRGTGEHANVITIQELAVIPVGPLYEDNFRDTEGVELPAHTPDIHPVGFVYRENLPDAPNLKIGSGGFYAISQIAAFPVSQYGIGTGVWLMNPALPYRLEMTVELYHVSVNTQASFFIESSTNPEAIVELDVWRQKISVYGGVLGYAEFPVSNDGIHSYTATVTSTGITVAMDGITVGTLTHDMSTATSFDLVGITLNPVDEATTTNFIRVALTQ
jgi:hypothetical protein